MLDIFKQEFDVLIKESVEHLQTLTSNELTKEERLVENRGGRRKCSTAKCFR